MTAPARILVVKLGGIGDLLQMTPCLDGLRRRYPEAHVSYLAPTYAREAVAGHPALDEVLAAGDLGAGGWRDALGLARLVGRLRAGRYDLAIIGNKTPWLAAAARLAGVGRVIGFTHPGGGRFLHDHVAVTPFRNVIDLHWELFALAGAARTTDLPRYVIRPADARAAAERLAAAGIAGPFLASSPGGGVTPWTAGWAKRWPAPRYAAVYDRLHRERGLPTVLLGGREDRDAIDAVLATAQSPLVDLAGSLPLGESAAVLARATAYLGNDSALLYLAGAVGTRTVGIFGPTDPREFLPDHARYRSVSHAVPCGPCWNQILGQRSPAFGCEHLSCTRDLPEERVYEALARALDVVAV